MTPIITRDPRVSPALTQAHTHRPAVAAETMQYIREAGAASSGFTAVGITMA